MSTPVTFSSSLPSSAALAGALVSFSSTALVGGTQPAAALEDADEQISQLIRSLQQQPAGDERITSYIFDAHGQRSSPAVKHPAGVVLSSVPPSTTSGHGVGIRGVAVGSPGPPTITTNVLKSSVVKTTSLSTASALFHESAQSPAMPVLTPQVSLPTSLVVTSRQLDEAAAAGTQTAGFQNTYLDSLARSQITDKRSAVRPRHLSSSSGHPAASGLSQAGVNSRLQQQQPPPLLSPPSGNSPRLSAAFSAAQSSPVRGTTPSVIQQNPRFDAPPQLQQATSSLTVQQTAGLGMGGVGSQIRAMQQHVPPNTRLVRGPNGQVTVQKVQTIELSQEMQHVSNKTLFLKVDK